MQQLLAHVPRDFHFMICEGVTDQGLPRIVAVRDESEVEDYVNERTIAISGVVVSASVNHRLPTIDALKNPEKLAVLANLPAFRLIFCNASPLQCVGPRRTSHR